MAIRYEDYRFITNDGGFLSEARIEDGGGGGEGGAAGGGDVPNPGELIATVNAVNPGTTNRLAGFFDQQIIGIPASIPNTVMKAAARQSDTIVITPQVLAEGFGSYLADILPPDIATTAGAFGASMQQVKNIMQVPVEKFAQVVASMETIQGLDLVNGTNIPTDVSEAQVAYELVALGTGPYKTFTYSDFYGCMSGLPYPWQQLQLLLADLQTANLANIYQNLYNAIIAGPQPYDPFTNPDPIAAYNASIQTQIDSANTEIAYIRTVRPGASMDLNYLYNKFAIQLGNEQRARNTGLSPLPDPRDPYINKYSVTEYSFVDSLPIYGKQTQPHMAAQTLEAISDLTFGAGQSIIAKMREARNQDRLNYIGVTLDNNIPDFIEKQKEWIANTPVTTTVIDPDNNVVGNIITLVGNTVPAYPNTTDPLGYYDPINQTYNVYVVPVTTNTSGNVTTAPTIYPNPFVPGGGTGGGLIAVTNPNSDPNYGPVIITGTPSVSGPGVGTTTTFVPAGTGRPANPADTGGPKVPGSFAKSPYQNLIPPQLNTLFTSDVLLPAQYNVPDAIEQVIDCNCDCWI